MQVAAVRVPVRDATRPAPDVRVEAGDAFALVKAATTDLPRATTALPAVSMAGPAARPELESTDAGEAGVDLTGWTIALYNGNGGGVWAWVAPGVVERGRWPVARPYPAGLLDLLVASGEPHDPVFVAVSCGSPS